MWRGSKRSGRPTALSAGLLTALICITAQGASRKPFGGTFEVPVLDSLRTTDPARVKSESEWMVSRQIHETLYRLHPDGRVVPALAQSMPRASSGGAELVIQLRPNSTFHDGSPVTTKEVIASWERLIESSTGSGYWWLLAPIKGAVAYRRGKITRITGLERINKLTLRIRLDLPTPDFTAALTALPTAVLPMRALKKKGHMVPHPQGAGPFLVSAGGDSGVMELHPFGGHWRGRPYLQRVVLRSFDSPRNALLAFELNQVDLGLRPPSRRAGEVRAVDGPANRQVFLVMNPKRLAGFTEGFRRALMQAIDRRSLAEYLVGERGGAMDEILVFRGSDREARELTPEPSKARAYFQGLAIKRMGLPAMLEFIVREDRPADRSAAERIQVDLVDVGVSVFVVPLKHQVYEERIREERYDFHLARPLPMVSSPELQLLGMVARVDGDQAVEDLLKSLARLPFDGSRPGIIRERARGYQVRTSWFPLFMHSRQVFVRDSVRGLRSGVDGVTDLAEVWLAM